MAILRFFELLYISLMLSIKSLKWISSTKLLERILGVRQAGHQKFVRRRAYLVQG